MSDSAPVRPDLTGTPANGPVPEGSVDPQITAGDEGPGAAGALSAEPQGSAPGASTGGSRARRRRRGSRGGRSRARTANGSPADDAGAGAGEVVAADEVASTGRPEPAPSVSDDPAAIATAPPSQAATAPETARPV